MHPNEHCNCRYADVGCDRMEQVMDQISGKWKMRILFMVGAHGTLRYGELRKLLDGVTHKMLSNQLKELAADGLVQRIDYNEVPPRVEYRLTENGEALMPIFDDIQNYIRRQSCGDCCKQETRHTCCEEYKAGLGAFGMRRLAILLAGAALLAGCAAPAVPEAASAVQAVSSEAGTGHAGSRTEQLAVLDGLVDFGADTAGCSLKTARAAAVLVEYLSASEFEDGTADTWRAGLSGDAQERLALNWPGILAEAQAICADPAACADELASAGVETDFPGMELDGVPDKLTALDAVLGAQGRPVK